MFLYGFWNVVGLGDLFWYCGRFVLERIYGLRFWGLFKIGLWFINLLSLIIIVYVMDWMFKLEN